MHHQWKKHGARCIGCILKLLSMVLCWHSVAATNEIDYLRLISDLPPISELVFSRKPAAALPTYYFLQCQGSNYVVRRATAPGRLRGTVSQMGSQDSCAGHCNGDYWTLALDNNRGIYTHGQKAKTPQIDVSVAVETLYQSCIEPLRLGLQVEDFKKVSWIGETFDFETLPIRARERRDRFNGRIHRNTDGQIAELTYEMEHDKLARHWYLKYDYSNPMIPRAFPSAYYRSMTMGHQPERKLDSALILSFVLATNPMPLEAFTAQRFLDLDSSQFQENLTSNNVFYVKRSNVWEKVDLSAYQMPGSLRAYSWFLKLSAAFVVLATGLAALKLVRGTPKNY